MKIRIGSLLIVGSLLAVPQLRAGEGPTGVDPSTKPVTSYNKLNQPNLCVDTDNIVFARVEEVHGGWFQAGRFRLIESIVTLSVERSVRGLPVGKEFKIRLLGGEVDGVIQVTDHPAMVVNDRYVLMFQDLSEGREFPFLHGWYRVPGTIVDLPTESAIVGVWNATCKHYAEGVFWRDPDVKLIIPPDLQLPGLQIDESLLPYIVYEHGDNK